MGVEGPRRRKKREGVHRSRCFHELTFSPLTSLTRYFLLSLFLCSLTIISLYHPNNLSDPVPHIPRQSSPSNTHLANTSPRFLLLALPLSSIVLPLFYDTTTTTTLHRPLTLSLSSALPSLHPSTPSQRPRSFNSRNGKAHQREWQDAEFDLLRSRARSWGEGVGENVRRGFGGD